MARAEAAATRHGSSNASSDVPSPVMLSRSVCAKRVANVPSGSSARAGKFAHMGAHFAASGTLAYSPLTGAGSTAIWRQSAPSSAATNCGISVVMPCPISNCGTATVITPSLAILSQASKICSPSRACSGFGKLRGYSVHAISRPPPAAAPTSNPRRVIAIVRRSPLPANQRLSAQLE